MRVIEADPKHRPPAPRGKFRNDITHGCHGYYQRGEKKHHRDYKSSGIICEINMGAHGAKVRMRKRKEEEMQLLVEGETIRERDPF